MDTELIHRYLRGETTPDEEKEIIVWLEASESNRFMFSSMMALDASLEEAGKDGAREARLLDRLDARIDADTPHRRIALAPWTGWAAAAVAVLVAVLAVTRPLLPGRQAATAVLMEHVTNTTSNVQQQVLPDGTKVYLTPGSTLCYNVAGLPDRRTVTLDGEAYFDVAKDPARPMRVEAGSIQVEVLGTAFSIRNWGGNTDTDVVLERGSVRILFQEGQKLFNLKPNQRATVLASTADILIEDMLAMPYITEKYNLVSLLNADIAQVVAMLEANYGVKITCTGGTPGRHFDINFLKTDSLKDVIDIVEYISGCHLSVSEGR